MAQASQSQQPVRPPPPPGYFDADAQASPAVKPPPPAGYFDADAAATPAVSKAATPPAPVDHTGQSHENVDWLRAAADRLAPAPLPKPQTEPTVQPENVNVLAEPRLAKTPWKPEDVDALRNSLTPGYRLGVTGPQRPQGLNEPIVNYDENANIPTDQGTAQYLSGLKARDTRPAPATNGVELANQGIKRGAVKAAEGLTTPANLLLAAGSEGLGAVPGIAGNVLRSMVSGYFSEQMLAGAYHSIPEIKAAADAGDTEKLSELLTGAGINTAMGAAAGVHAGGELFGREAQTGEPNVEPEVTQPPVQPAVRRPVSQTAAALDAIKLAPIDEGTPARPQIGPEPPVNAEMANAPAAKPVEATPELPPEKTTENVYRHPLTGDWDQARKEAVQYPAVDAELDGKKPPTGRPPEAVVLNGGTASGKTTVTKRLMGEDANRVNVDADKMKLAIPEFEGMKQTDPDNASARVQKESAYMAKQLLAEAADNGLDLIYDRTTAGGDVLQYLKDKGYYVKVIGVDIPTEMAKERAMKRAMESTDPTNRGRIVPENIIEEKHLEAAQQGLAALHSPYADEAHLYDNTGKNPEPIASRVDGEQPIVHNGERFEQFRRKAQGNETAQAEEVAAWNVPGQPGADQNRPAGNGEARAGGPQPSEATASEATQQPGAYRPVSGNGAVVKVPTSDIATDSARFQPRRGVNPGRVEAIRQNMERSGEFGDKFPLDVWRDPQDGKLKVMAGHHRLEAAKLAGLPEVTARIHADLSPEEAEDFARRSNSQAAPLTPMENARAFRSEMDRGRTPETISKEYGSISTSKISDLAKLTNLPSELQDRIQDGTLEPAMGIAMAKAAERHKLPPEMLAEVYDKIVKTTEMTPTELSRMLDTLAPAAAKQMKMGLGFELPTGFMDPLKDYLKTMRDLNSSRNKMRAYANEIDKMERQGETVTQAEMRAKELAVKRVERLQAQVAKMEKDLGRGKMPTAQTLMREPSVLSELKPKEEEPRVEAQQTKGILPGMEPTVKAEAEAAGKVQAEKLTEKMNTPISVEEKAGNMERESPLFRNSGAGGQTTLYANPLFSKQAWTDALGYLAPPEATEPKQMGHAILREETGKAARLKEQMYEALKDERKRWSKRSPEAMMAFVDAIENGPADRSSRGVTLSAATQARLAAGAKELTPEDAKLAGTLRTLLDDGRQAVQNLGTGRLQQFIQDYFPHIWEKPGRVTQFIQQMMGKKPLAGAKSFLKSRTIPTTAEGVDFGLKPVDWNPVNLALLKMQEMNRYVMSENIRLQGKDAGMVKFARSRNNAPPGWTRVDPWDVYNWDSGANGLIYRGSYYAPADFAKSINRYLSPGLRGTAGYDLARGFGNLMNQIQLGMSGFHLGTSAINGVVSQVALSAKQMSEGKPLSAAKSLLTAPLAPVTMALRGSKVMGEYLDPGRLAKYTKSADALAEAGGRVRVDPFYSGNAIESVVKHWKDGNYVKAAGNALLTPIEAQAKPIMGYAMRMKLGAFHDMASDVLEQAQAKNWSPEETRQAIQKAWDSADNRFGQLVYDNLNWNRVVKDLSQAGLRSVGWNYGTLRELGGGLMDVPRQAGAALTGKGFKVTDRMAYTFALPVVVGMMGAVYQYMHTGTYPQDLRDYFYPKNGRKTASGEDDRVSFPSYMKDVYAYSQHPLDTVWHKASPGAAMIAEMLENKDYYGTEIRHQDDPAVQQIGQEIGYVGRQFIPFSARNVMERTGSAELGEGMRKAAQNPGKAAESFLGVVPAPRATIRTNAENLMRRYLDEDAPPGTRTAEEAAHGRAVAEWRSKLSNGEAKRGDLAKAVQSGDLTQREALTLLQQQHTPALVGESAHLNLYQLLRVYDVASDKEKTLLKPVLTRKANNPASFEAMTTAQRKQIMAAVRGVLHPQAQGPIYAGGTQ